MSVKSTVYRLTAPGTIRETESVRDIPEGHVVVEPTAASICHADLRYYTGNRRPEILARKLPMALIHEGIGRIVAGSPDETGHRVVIVPNIPGHLAARTASTECCPACSADPGGNYCYHGMFLGSGVDGIAQSRLVIPAECAIPVPDEVPDEIAVLTELCSVSFQAANRINRQLTDAKVAVFGDGPVGYLMAAVLAHVFGVSRERLHVFGAIPDKLENFTFSSTSLVGHYDFQINAKSFDVVFECTGGKFSESAANQAIDLLRPLGHLVLMGVSEDRVPLNTRDVLEKGITMLGSSRSCTLDYPPVLHAMKSPDFQETLRRLLPESHFSVAEAEDFARAMDETAAHREWKKTLMKFHWNQKPHHDT